jgi:uncharacterized protein (DUF433 family)
METVLSINLIVSNPNVRGGRPVIAGTEIRVTDIVTAMFFQKGTVDDIAGWYKLSLAQVHAALAYYYEHKAEIDQDIKQQADLFEEYKAKRFGNRD